MPGRLDRNLRQGQNAEHTGIDLLRPFVAVAPVPVTDDLGFDAVAILLRRDGRFLYAEDSFCVQFKARSVRSISYEPHAYKWFLELKMPLFIGSVDLATRSIQLFSSEFLATRPDAHSYTSAVLHLDQDSKTICPDDGIVHQWLGPPILEWSAADCEHDEFRQLAYDVLKSWMLLSYANLALRPIRTRRGVQWKTNEVPLEGWTSVMGHPSELDDDLRAALPYLNKVGIHFFGSETKEPLAAQVGLFLLMNWIDAKGLQDVPVMNRMLQAQFQQRFEQYHLQLKFNQ